jgi:hypothetical protein
LTSPAQEAAWPTRTVVGLIIGVLGLLVEFGVAFVLFDALTVAVTGISALAVIAGGFFAQAKYPRVSARHGPAIVRLLLAVVVLAAVAMGGAGYHRAHRAIDVTARVQLGGNLAVLPGRSATLDLAVPESRPRFTVLFRVSDHNPQTGICAPQTELRVTPVRNGNHGETVTADDTGHVVVPVFAHARDLHLEVEVRNVHRDNGCAVDIAVTSARLIS